MQRIQGSAIAAGLVVAPVRVLQRHAVSLTRQRSAPHTARALFFAAKAIARDELQEIGKNAQGTEKDIFLFQLALVDDQGLTQEALFHIDEGYDAPSSVLQAAEVYIAKLREVEDEYIRMRTADVSDVAQRMVDILHGRQRRSLSFSTPCLLAAKEILPSDLVALDKEMIRGFLTEEGSYQSHAAILARSMGVPAVGLPAGTVDSLQDGQLAAVDGVRGEIFLDPDEATVARFSHRIRLSERPSLARERLLHAPCITKEGVRVHLMANCASAKEITTALERGAEGVGLLRSEYLFMQPRLPTEATQLAFYKECLAVAEGRPVTIRTFDIGADKKVEGLSLPEEQNPALGLRGLRLGLARKEVLRHQLRALLQAGALEGADLSVMFPMVSSPADFAAAMEEVQTAREQLLEEGLAVGGHIRWGIMVETPGAALQAAELAERCDFFSFGTNDLTQYTLAVDRGNPAVAAYYQADSPAVLRLMELAARAIRKAKKKMSVCGESAADPALAQRYIQMGIHTLSMASPAILALKEALIGEGE